eukprot:CAMPEP_0201581272 /NCGR_PEP_ID=MMETSP0190_2-20130828/65327_1 /ASSEMBLY_ACC=CAM_ASM_000263 /TAXON_ID=37353 /ORGANISM="Rosalina sp." /LENGTH=66 /DNA_ID=CAMNT_0048018861 /DNA_START=36 /DNA_END=233 /DNA_ORIENTATION=-
MVGSPAYKIGSTGSQCPNGKGSDGLCLGSSPSGSPSPSPPSGSNGGSNGGSKGGSLAELCGGCGNW